MKRIIKFIFISIIMRPNFMHFRQKMNFKSAIDIFAPVNGHLRTALKDAHGEHTSYSPRSLVWTIGLTHQYHHTMPNFHSLFWCVLNKLMLLDKCTIICFFLIIFIVVLPLSPILLYNFKHDLRPPCLDIHFCWIQFCSFIQ